MLREEVSRYRRLSGDTSERTNISRIGGYLDGYEDGLEDGKKESRYCPNCGAKMESVSSTDSTTDSSTDSSTGGWIPTAERLPEIEKTVLICDIAGDIYLAHRYDYKNNTRFIDYTGDKIKDVKAWMPLPEPYKG